MWTRTRYRDSVLRVRRLIVLLITLSTLLSSVADARSAHAARRSVTPNTIRAELLGDADQIVLVTSPWWRASTAIVTMYQRIDSRWKRVAGPYYGRIGRNGTRVRRSEGDGTTPAGSFRIVSALGYSTTPGTRLAYTQLLRGSCWISDPSRVDYNTMVHEPGCSAPNEDLYRIAKGGPYRRVLVTGYNMDPVTPGLGSAIFIHSHAYTPLGAAKATRGCITLTAASLASLWRRLDPELRPRVVIGPRNWLLA